MSKINIEGISDFQRRRNYSHIITVIMFRSGSTRCANRVLQDVHTGFYRMCTPGSTRYAHRVLQDLHTGFYKMFRPGSTRCAHTLLKNRKEKKKSLILICDEMTNEKCFATMMSSGA